MSSQSRRSVHYSRFHVTVAFFVGCCVGSLLLTAVHVSHLDNYQQQQSASTISGSAAHHHPWKQQQQQYVADAVIKEAAAVTEKQEPPKEKDLAVFPKPPQQNNKINIAANHDNVVHPVAGLQCHEHGGPSATDAAQEMVYWRDLPQDNDWTSPFLSKQKDDDNGLRRRQYLTFEPDGGGWNNIRMRCVCILIIVRWLRGYRSRR